MSLPSNVYTQLEQHFAEWAQTQPVIHAVIVVGSRARTDHPADEWSDLDMVVFAGNTASYLHDPSWLNTFGDVIAAISDSFGQHDRELIAVYADGCKIDVAFLSIDPAATPTLQVMLDAFPYPIVLQRGVRVLVDKTAPGPSQLLRLPTSTMSALPTEDEFTEAINRLLVEALKTAKFIRRRDLWRAKQMCDGELKQHLLKMLEWHAVALHGRDIWYDGRYLDEWADGRALSVLPLTFASYQIDDLRRALFATYRLFRWLAQETAQQLGYRYPFEADQKVEQYLQRILPEGQLPS